MEIFILGSSGSIPTLKRNLPSLVLRRDGKLYMFDCGEGTQMQIIKSGLSLAKFEFVFISHLHGDHVTGLPGFLMLLTQASRQLPLTIFGPAGLKDYLESIQRTLNFYSEYQIIIKEITSEGIIYQEKEFYIETVRADHNVFTLAYAFVENPRPGRFYPEKALLWGLKPGPIYKKLQEGESVLLENGQEIKPEMVIGFPRAGRKFVYATDTRPSRKIVYLAQAADLLVHDGMFADEETEDAAAKGHSTVAQAAEIACAAEVKKLVVSHISSRYTQNQILKDQARKIFPETYVAYDLMTIEVPFQEEDDG